MSLSKSLSWTKSPQLPVVAEMANIHLRLGGDDDLQLPAHMMYLPAAAEWAENSTQRTLIESAHVWVLWRFPYGDNELVLPRGICQSVTSIEYYSQGLQTLVGFQSDLSSEDGGRVRPAVGASWPSVDQEYINPVIITYQAGYATVEEVPQAIQVAIVMQAAYLLENPDSDSSLSDMGAETQISAYRLDKTW